MSLAVYLRAKGAAGAQWRLASGTCARRSSSQRSTRRVIWGRPQATGAAQHHTTLAFAALEVVKTPQYAADVLRKRWVSASPAAPEKLTSGVASRNSYSCAIARSFVSSMLITILAMIKPTAVQAQIRFLRLIPGWKYASRSGSYLVGQGCCRPPCAGGNWCAISLKKSSPPTQRSRLKPAGHRSWR